MGADFALARLDAERLRRLGNMLVTEAPAEAVQAEEALVDLSKLDGSALIERFKARYKHRATTPFDPQGDQFSLFPGGVTLWSGFPGAGKTTLLRQFVCHTLHRGSSVFLASLEEHPEDTVIWLASTAWACDPEKLTGHQMQCFIDAYSERLKVWALVGGVTDHAKVLAVVRALAEKGTRHAVIDSLMKLDVANDDLDAQRRFANLLSAVARLAKCHIHLVAHPRKLVSAEQELDLNDVAGARELGGIADNVIFVRRKTDKAHYTAGTGETPMSVAIRKQRHGTGALGEVNGWLARSHRQFHVEQFSSPTRYLPDWAYA